MVQCGFCAVKQILLKPTWIHKKYIISLFTSDSHILAINLYFFAYRYTSLVTMPRALFMLVLVYHSPEHVIFEGNIWGNKARFKQKKIYDKHSTVRKTKQNKLKFRHTDFAGSLKNVLLCHTVIVVSHMHIPYCCHSRSCSDNMHSRKRSFL